MVLQCGVYQNEVTYGFDIEIYRLNGILIVESTNGGNVTASGLSTQLTDNRVSTPVPVGGDLTINMNHTTEGNDVYIHNCLLYETDDIRIDVRGSVQMEGCYVTGTYHSDIVVDSRDVMLFNCIARDDIVVRDCSDALVRGCIAMDDLAIKAQYGWSDVTLVSCYVEDKLYVTTGNGNDVVSLGSIYCARADIKMAGGNDFLIFTSSSIPLVWVPSTMDMANVFVDGGSNYDTVFRGGTNIVSSWNSINVETFK